MVDLSTPGWRTSNSVDYRRSDGFRHDTGFEIWNASSNHALEMLGSTYSVLLGFTNKRFGAFDFYSPGLNIPSKEWTPTGFGSVRTGYLVSSLLVEPSIYYRHHDDKFMFDIRTPNQYVNIHHDESYGGRIFGTLRLANAGVVVGRIEDGADQITSSNLGDHGRSLVSTFVNANYSATELIHFDGGLRYDVRSMYGSQLNPTAGINVVLQGRGKIL